MLPIDIWLNVFEYLNKEDLLTLSQVSKFLNQLSVGIIFKTISLPKRSLFTSNSIENSVRHLIINCDSWMDKKEINYISKFKNLYSLHLRNLSLFVSENYELSIKTLKLLYNYNITLEDFLQFSNVVNELIMECIMVPLKYFTYIIEIVSNKFPNLTMLTIKTHNLHRKLIGMHFKKYYNFGLLIVDESNGNNYKVM